MMALKCQLCEFMNKPHVENLWSLEQVLAWLHFAWEFIQAKSDKF